MTKREIIALTMSIFAVVLWFAENMYFGWHPKAMTPAEGIADFLVIALWVVAFFIKPARIEKKEIMNNVQSARFEISKSDVSIVRKEDDISNKN